jgi:hypothetical protein
MDVSVIIVAFGLLCWVLFNLAAHALPVLVGTAAGFAAYDTGAGVAGAIIVAVVAGGVTMVAAQGAIQRSQSPMIRTTIALLFAGPAAFAGYGMTLSLAQLGMPSAVWQQAFALSGAVVAGAAALARVTNLPNPNRR